MAKTGNYHFLFPWLLPWNAIAPRILLDILKLEYVTYMESIVSYSNVAAFVCFSFIKMVKIGYFIKLFDPTMYSGVR